MIDIRGLAYEIEKLVNIDLQVETETSAAA